MKTNEISTIPNLRVFEHVCQLLSPKVVDLEVVLGGLWRSLRTRVPSIEPLGGRFGNHFGWFLHVFLGVSLGCLLEVDLDVSWRLFGASGKPLGGRLGPWDRVHVERVLAELLLPDVSSH